MRRITIFGATGSIGQNTLDLIGRDPDAYKVVALTGGQNIEIFQLRFLHIIREGPFGLNELAQTLFFLNTEGLIQGSASEIGVDNQCF